MVRRPTMTVFGARGFVPLLASLLLSALMLLPVGTGVSGVAMPHLAMICVFYWSCTRPLMLPYGACAFIGLMLDLWLDVPLGMNVLVLVLTRLFVVNQIKYFKGRSRLVYWGVFSVMAAAMFAMMWVVTSIVRGQMIQPESAFVQFLLTSIAYALVGLILGRLRRSLLK